MEHNKTRKRPLNALAARRARYGSIDPPAASIQRNGNVYTLTGNVTSVADGIVVERDDIVVDGSGFAVEGNASYGTHGILLHGRSNVTIQNTNIQSFGDGIFLNISSNNRIFGNNITNNDLHGIWLNSSSNYNSLSGNNIEDNYNDGIMLSDSSNYNSIEGNNITDSDYGIYLGYSSNNRIDKDNIAKSYLSGIGLVSSSSNSMNGNNLANNEYSIELSSSNRNSLSGNTLTNNTEGIALSYSNNNSISGNTIARCTFFGVELLLSDNNSISVNTFSDCGLFVEYSYENVVADNLVNGKPLVYFEDVSDRVVEDAGQVILVNCNRISVENSNLSHTTSGVELWQTNNTRVSRNNITDTQSHGILLHNSSSTSISENYMANNRDWGIRLKYSPNNTIDRNNITNTNYCGIELDYSWYNNISRNNITNNGLGIWFDGCSNNNITENYIADNVVVGIELLSSSTYNSMIRNTIANNGYYGISLQSDRRVLDATDNTVFHNNFINNTVEVKSWTSERANIWNSGCEGNYWSAYNGTDLDNDGVGDTGLPWEGVDNYPLMNIYWNPCDINHDLEVNRTDIDISARSFGTIPGYALWNPHADITGPEQLVSDGKVDMRDIGLIARHFGEHYS